MIAQRGPDLVEYTTCCDYCGELPDGTEQLVAFGELGNLFLHPACQQRMLDRFSAIGDPVTDLNGDLIMPSTWSASERSEHEP